MVLLSRSCRPSRVESRRCVVRMTVHKPVLPLMARVLEVAPKPPKPLAGIASGTGIADVGPHRLSLRLWGGSFESSTCFVIMADVLTSERTDLGDTGETTHG